MFTDLSLKTRTSRKCTNGRSVPERFRVRSLATEISGIEVTSLNSLLDLSSPSELAQQKNVQDALRCTWSRHPSLTSCWSSQLSRWWSFKTLRTIAIKKTKLSKRSRTRMIFDLLRRSRTYLMSKKTILSYTNLSPNLNKKVTKEIATGSWTYARA